MQVEKDKVIYNAIRQNIIEELYLNSKNLAKSILALEEEIKGADKNKKSKLNKEQKKN